MFDQDFSKKVKDALSEKNVIKRDEKIKRTLDEMGILENRTEILTAFTEFRSEEFEKLDEVAEAFNNDGRHGV